MIKICEAKDKDIPFLSEVCKDASKLYDSILPGAFEKQAKKFLKQGLPETYNIGIVNKGNEKLGFIGTVELNSNTIYLTAIYLLECYQKQGYGKIIINYIEKDVYRKGINKLVLLVHLKAHWAIDFYIKNGFRIIETEENNIKKYLDYRMSKYFLPSTILMEKVLLNCECS